MKRFWKRYWHDVPFALLAFRAVWLASAAWGLSTILYFFIIIVPTEYRHFQNDKIQRELKIKNKIA